MTTRGSEESKEKRVKNYEKKVRGSMTNDHYIFNTKGIVTVNSLNQGPNTLD
jgi:hypothetical protein